MPLTKREAEIRNNPLRNEAAAMAIWNAVQEKTEGSISWTDMQLAVVRQLTPRTANAKMSKRATRDRNVSSTWEADPP